jgi:prepilin-type processing-associated H-X9-DG protein
LAPASETILVCETNESSVIWPYWNQGLCAFSGGGSRGGCAGWTTDGENVWSDHLSTSNYLFCDGHVKALKATQTATPKNMWTVEEDIADTAQGNQTLVYMTAVQAAYK